MLGYKFDYEKKVWGGDIILLRPIYFRASRLKYALKELAKVKGKILDINLIETRIKTKEGDEVLVPNSLLLKFKVEKKN